MKKIVCIATALFIFAAGFAAFGALPAAASDPEPATVWDGVIPEANATFDFGGAGTEADPYTIDTAAELAQLAANCRDRSEETTYAGKFFKLTADIDLNSKPWLGIGGCQRKTDGTASYGIAEADAGKSYFSGTFDGDNHIVKNLVLADDQHVNALFGHVCGGTVKNVGVVGGTSVLKDCTRVAALVGVAKMGSKIENCYSVDINITVTYESFTPQIHASTFIAAIYDASPVVEVKNCYTSGKLTLNNVVNEYRIGGFIGQSLKGSSLTNCYSFTDVSLTSVSESSSAKYTVGGLVGSLMDAGIMTNCYAGGNLTVKNVTEGKGTTAYIAGLAGAYGATPVVSGCSYYKPEGTQAATAVGAKTDDVTGITPLAAAKTPADITEIKYNITWLVEGVATVEKYSYGATPAFTGNTDKASVGGVQYTYSGWDVTPAAVTANAVYTAQYTENPGTADAGIILILMLALASGIGAVCAGLTLRRRNNG